MELSRGNSRTTHTKIINAVNTVKVTRLRKICWLWVDLFHEQAVKSDINKTLITRHVTIHLLNGLRIKRDLIVVIS